MRTDTFIVNKTDKELTAEIVCAYLSNFHQYRLIGNNSSREIVIDELINSKKDEYEPQSLNSIIESVYNTISKLGK